MNTNDFDMLKNEFSMLKLYINEFSYVTLILNEECYYN